METTLVSWGYTGIMEKKMEFTEFGALSELRVPKGPPIRITAGHSLYRALSLELL